METSGVEKNHNVMRLRQLCKIHCSLPSIKRVADSQPIESLTAEAADKGTAVGLAQPGERPGATQRPAQGR